MYGTKWAPKELNVVIIIQPNYLLGDAEFIKHHNWTKINKAFSDEFCNSLLNFYPDPVVVDYVGKRDGANDIRTFVTREKTPEFAKLFDNWNTAVARLYFTQLSGVDCMKGKLRIEACQDGPGFFLENHIDIPEKLLTLQIYLGEGDSNWGTSLYNDDQTLHHLVEFKHNTGYLFSKTSQLIHGVPGGVVTGLRRSILINYVVGDWKDTDQLY